jgi:adenosine deaminase
MKKITLSILMLGLCTTLAAQTNSETATSQYFDGIKSNPQKLNAFLYDMPKGGDLHNHHGGSSMAENMIRYAKGDRFCVDDKTFQVDNNKFCSANNLLDAEALHVKSYHHLIAAWSMKGFHAGRETGHDHFFASFEKYIPIVTLHTGEVLTEIVDRAGSQNELYVELMVTPDNNMSGLLGKKIGWDTDLNNLREKLLKADLGSIVSQISKALDADENKLSLTLNCKTKNAKPGCHVKIRYLYQVLREQPPENVFAQLLAGFEAASKDSRIVGINMVQPEDGKIAMRDYDLHMRMVDFLHRVYPKVNISLHAGELVPGLAPEAGLRSHIRQAVEIAHAQRIGHGVDISHEDNYEQLLNEMARKHVMVEINLVSNAEILGIEGRHHPLPLYMKHKVPVALSTDDEGVLRTNLTDQYKKAVSAYGFSYSAIKNLVRNSIAYSFLPGQGLWSDDNYQHVVGACKNDSLGDNTVSDTCKRFLNENEKADLQWQLEKRFSLFEANYSAQGCRVD